MGVCDCANTRLAVNNISALSFMGAVRSGVRKLTVYQGVNAGRGRKTEFKTEMRRAVAG